MSARSEIELVRAAYAPANSDREYYEKHVRPPALAEIESRGIDVAAVRRRIQAAITELKKLDEWELTIVSIDDDAEGIWRIAADLCMGRDPLAGIPVGDDETCSGPVKRVRGQPRKRAVPGST